MTAAWIELQNSEWSVLGQDPNNYNSFVGQVSSEFTNQTIGGIDLKIGYTFGTTLSVQLAAIYAGINPSSNQSFESIHSNPKLIESNTRLISAADNKYEIDYDFEKSIAVAILYTEPAQKFGPFQKYITAGGDTYSIPDYQWIQIDLPSALFTPGADSVDFNSLSGDQRLAIAGGANVSNSLGATSGTDTIHLPSKTTLNRLAADTSSDGQKIYQSVLSLHNTTIHTGVGTATVYGSDDTSTIAGIDSGTNTGETGDKTIISGTGDIKVLFPADRSAYDLSYTARDYLTSYVAFSSRTNGKETLEGNVTPIFTSSTDGSLDVEDISKLRPIAALKMFFDEQSKLFNAFNSIDSVKKEYPALSGFLTAYSAIHDAVIVASELPTLKDREKVIFVESLQLLLKADKSFVDGYLGEGVAAHLITQSQMDSVDKSIDTFIDAAKINGGQIYDRIMSNTDAALTKFGEIIGTIKTDNDTIFQKQHPEINNFHPVDGVPTIQSTPGLTNNTLSFSDFTYYISKDVLVNDSYYYAVNQDVLSASLPPDDHYNQNGWHEGRNPNADFSTVGYLAANQDVAKAGINPLSHYDANGWKEGRDPSANFDNELYLLNNPDVKAAGIDPLVHYHASGQAEGRQAYAAIGQASSFTHGSFDAEYYLLANGDVAKAALASGGDTFAFAFQHYQNNGWKEGRAADAYFDSAYYLAHNPDVAAAGINPLIHYDQVGWKEGRDPSAAFHTNAYLAANPDIAAAHIDPLTHYLQYGADEGRHLA